MELSKKDKHWQSVFEDFKRHGVSQRQYCIAKDIQLSTFRYYWGKLQSRKHGDEKPNSSSGFVPVLCAEQTTKPVKATSPVLSFTLPNNIRCELNVGGSTESLNKILSALVAL